MKILFFDIESNGLPRDWKAPMKKVDNWPRVVQLGWILADMDGDQLSEYCTMILPDNWTIPNEAFWVQHNLTMERAKAEGVPMPEVLETLLNDLNQADVVVSHNINFDYNVLGAEMIRYGVKANGKKEKVCTMTVSTDLMKLPGRFKGTYKFPKLEELHRFLFEEDFDGAHDALVDVMACVRCFFELVNRGVILIGDGVKV